MQIFSCIEFLAEPKERKSRFSIAGVSFLRAERRHRLNAILIRLSRRPLRRKALFYFSFLR